MFGRAGGATAGEGFGAALARYLDDVANATNSARTTALENWLAPKPATRRLPWPQDKLDGLARRGRAPKFPRATISGYCAGKTVPDVETVRALVATAGCLVLHHALNGGLDRSASKETLPSAALLGWIVDHLAHLHGLSSPPSGDMPAPCEDPRHHGRLRAHVTSYLSDYAKTWLPRAEALLASLTQGRPPPTWMQDYRGAVLRKHQSLTLHGRQHTFHLPLEEVYVPVSVREDPLGPATRQHGPPMVVEEIFRCARHAFVEGDAGTGKSTALKKVLVTLLSPAAPVPGVPQGALPLFLRLADYGAHRSLEALALETIRSLGLPEATAREVWRHRPLVLLLDGLDEMADDRERQTLLDSLDAELGADDEVGVVVSCRPSGRGPLVEPPETFRLFKVLQLDDEHPQGPEHGPRAELVRRWFGALERHHQAAGTRYPNRARDEQRVIDLLLSDRVAHQDARTILSTPLFIGLLCTIAADQDELPTGESGIFQAALTVLLQRPTRKAPKDAPPWSAPQAQAVLQPLSYHLQAQHATQSVLDQHQWLNLLGPHLLALGPAAGLTQVTAWMEDNRALLARHGVTWSEDAWAALLADPALTRRAPSTAQEFLGWLHHDAGLLEQAGLQQYRFQHRAFPEYLAAAYLLTQDYGETLARNLPQPDWRDTILYAIHLGQTAAFDALVDALLDLKPRWFEDDAGWPAQEVLRRMQEVLRQLHQPYSGPFATDLPTAPEEEQQAILRLFMNAADEPLLDAAERLRSKASPQVRALIDDLLKQRAQVTGLDWRKDQLVLDLGVDERGQPVTLTLLRVPEGTLRMGSKAWENTQPIHDVRLSQFWLGQDPVTNHQYARFLAAAPRTREPSAWRNRKYNHPAQPVVGVTWHEARAFCRWLQALAGGPEALQVDLPTEAQWERAARGVGDRDYPWGHGEKPKGEVAYGRRLEDGPAQVGTHPADTGPFGHRDLAGNVWDWCRDAYVDNAYAGRAQGEPRRDPWLDPESPEAGGTKRRALRGGAFWYDVGLCASACRSDGVADDDYVFVGFRVCVSPPSTV